MFLEVTGKFSQIKGPYLEIVFLKSAKKKEGFTPLLFDKDDYF
tara:strand:+ start:337 stop:465 length:129 start_codon:yes stop_codon:yes gene_type:complete